MKECNAMIRLFDLFLSTFTLILLLPLFIPLALLLCCTGEGKVFYGQKRIGSGKKTFNLLKFATMLEDSPNLPGGDITSGNDPRVLPVGKLLRKTKINELPQLINILRGDISIIGPRPLTPKNFQFYSEKVQSKLSTVRPGLSGIGSIVFRNEESVIASSEMNAIDLYRETISPYKGELECWFINNKNLSLYFVLIAITGWIILFSRSKIIWNMFPSLPTPPDALKPHLNFNDQIDLNLSNSTVEERIEIKSRIP